MDYVNFYHATVWPGPSVGNFALGLDVVEDRSVRAQHPFLDGPYRPRRSRRRPRFLRPAVSVVFAATALLSLAGVTAALLTGLL